MVILHAPVIDSLLGNPQDAGLYGQQTLRSFIIVVTQVLKLAARAVTTKDDFDTLAVDIDTII